MGKYTVTAGLCIYDIALHLYGSIEALQNPDGTYRYDAYPFFEQYKDNANSYISLSLSVPIFGGFQKRKAVRRAKIVV